MSFRPRTLPTACQATASRTVSPGVFAAPGAGPRQGKGLPEIVPEGCLYERRRTVARTAGRNHRIHHAPAQDRGMMAAEDDKLEIVLDRTIEVRETRKLFRLAPASEHDLTRSSRRLPSSLRIRRTRPGRSRPCTTHLDAIGGIRISPPATAWKRRRPTEVICASRRASGRRPPPARSGRFPTPSPRPAFGDEYSLDPSAYGVAPLRSWPAAPRTQIFAANARGSSPVLAIAAPSETSPHSKARQYSLKIGLARAAWRKWPAAPLAS